MARQGSTFFVSVGGIDVTGGFTAITTSITVTDSSGAGSDTASIEVTDDNGRVALPKIGDPMTIGLGWAAPVIVFDGFVDSVKSAGSRGGGRSLSITGKSADTVKGKGKQRAQRHKDDATLGDTVKEFGQKAGIGEVYVHADLTSIERPYWSMNNESFMAWGQRIAKEVGATFKIIGTRAVMVPRSSGVSASGAALVPVTATFGENLIDWDITPATGRPQAAKSRTGYFDEEDAEWKAEAEENEYETEAEAEDVSPYSELEPDRAKRKSKSRGKESDRERGGGSVTIEGNPFAQAEATCIVVGARPGVDGPYRIDSVTHSRTRGGGFTTSLTLKQPGEGTGKDDR